MEDFDGKDKEPEGAGKKIDKYSEYDDHFFKNCFAPSNTASYKLGINSKPLIFCDGYCEIVYSPPEQA